MLHVAIVSVAIVIVMVMAATVLVMPCPDLTQIIRTAGDTIGGLICKNDASIFASLINGEIDFSDYTRSHRGKRVEDGIRAIKANNRSHLSVRCTGRCG